MILARPLFLLALAALPALWLLARRAARRRTVAVPGLLIWRRLGLAAAPPDRWRRRTDLLLWLRLAAAALIAFGAAGLGLAPGAPPSVLHVVVDTSPSMSAFAPATAAARRAIDEAAAARGLEVEVHESPGLEDLGSVLGAAGEGDVVAITDGGPPEGKGAERVLVFSVGRPVENVGIVAAWIDPGPEPLFTAVVRSFAHEERAVRVAFPGGGVDLTLAPGDERVVRGPAPGGEARVRLEPGDAFAFDDEVALALTPPGRVRLSGPTRGEPRSTLALTLSGVTVSEGWPGDLVYGAAPGPETRLLIAPSGEKRPVDTASLVGSGGLAADAVPAPGTPLGSAVRLPAGAGVLLADRHGPLVVLRGGRTEVALDPADPASGWAEDPSFPIFWGEIARRLGARPPESRVVAGRIDPAESATVPAPPASPDLTRLRGTPAGGTAPVDLSPWFLFAAAAALLAHAILEARVVSYRAHGIR